MYDWGGGDGSAVDDSYVFRVKKMKSKEIFTIASSPVSDMDRDWFQSEFLAHNLENRCRAEPWRGRIARGQALVKRVSVCHRRINSL